MPNDSPVTNSSDSPAAVPAAPDADSCIIKRADGVYVDPTVLGQAFQTAVNNIFFANTFFVGLNYPVFIKALYDCGPDLPRSRTGDLLIRFAADIVEFNPDRRSLYKAVKINNGVAEYYFEPVYLARPDSPDSTGDLAQLTFDEFVADMWIKGIRFGIDALAVRSAIATSKCERVVVARRLDAAPGQDATIIEVSEDIHRSDAPRQLANGKLDLMAFQNRFPQIKQGARLLRKVPRRAGTLGFEMSGTPIEPAVPNDIDLGALAGAGTLIEQADNCDVLVAQVSGFLNVESQTNRLSIGDKIVSREGVSSRTTGNLQLTGDYEEFGEVQEKRVIEGESITIHADVFGNIVSRGGTVLLNHNLVGGTAHNANGDIHVKGMASGSVLQTAQGEIVLHNAESCVVSGTRVTIEHAINCEIIADEVTITLAEGCAIAGRRVAIDSAGPRKQSEMLIYALVPDSGKADRTIAELQGRIAEFEALAHKRAQELDALTNMPEVRKYMMLATKIRKKELILNPEQVVQFQKMAVAVGPALKTIGKISLDLKTLETGKQTGLEMMGKLVQQKSDADGGGHVTVKMMSGDTLVRTMGFDPDGTRVYDVPAKDIKTRLRGSSTSGKLIFSGSRGVVDWDVEKP